MGFPAYAGMDPGCRGRRPAPARVPRTRGDGPRKTALPAPLDAGSPHTRGWTRAERGRGLARRGFPAHAGMDPPAAAPPSARPGVPRTRGDGPAPFTWAGGKRRGSPHTRGWTHVPPGALDGGEGFPAHAGMDPAPFLRDTAHGRVPRTRGDGPFTSSTVLMPPAGSPHTRGWTGQANPARPAVAGFPAHAGMDPNGKTDLPRDHGVSPHTRGWTRFPT